MYKMKNELTIDVMGTGSNLNPFPGNDSSSRIVMFTGQLGQALVVAGSTPRRCQTGAEREYGKYTFKIEMPVDASIIRVVEKYPRTITNGGMKYNPESMVIYESYDTQEIGCLALTRYHCRHQSFGFEFVQNQANHNKLIQGAFVPKGAVFAHSPSVKPNGEYAYGLEVQACAMSIPAVIEDGFCVSKSLIARLISKGIETRTASWGSEYYPLNLYGDLEHYKPFPDIGDKVRDDGLVFALRRYDPILCVVEMTPEALMKPDFTFDRLVYAEPGSEVVNVQVLHDLGQNNGTTPVGMETQTEKYHEAELLYRSKILDTYNDLRRKRRDGLTPTPKFHQVVVNAIADNPNAVKQRVMKTYRRKPIDDWRVEVTLMHDIVPNIGFKLTDCHGGF